MRTVHDIENHRRARHKELLLSVVDSFRAQVENDEVLEFVVGAINEVGDVDVVVASLDRYSAVGILEIAKQQLITASDESDFEDGFDEDYDNQGDDDNDY